jgi:hypothetical protein
MSEFDLNEGGAKESRCDAASLKVWEQHCVSVAELPYHSLLAIQF